MGGDCVDVSMWLGWVQWRAGSDTTQNSRLTCLLCGASRTGLPPSLALSRSPSACLPNIRFALTPHFSNLSGCLPSAAGASLSARPFHHRRLWFGTLTCLTTPNLRQPRRKEVQWLGPCLLISALLFFFLLFPRSWPVGCEGGSRSERPVK